MTGFSRFLRFGFFSLTLLPCAVPVYGAPPDDAGRMAVLQEVVVTATRDREEIRKVPAHVTVITEKEIRDSGATSLVEILERQGGFNSARTAVMSPFPSSTCAGWAATAPSGRSRFSSTEED